MGMVMEVFAVRESTLDRLLADPPLIWTLISPDFPEIYRQARAEASGKSQGLLGRLFGLKPAANPADPPPLALADDEGRVVDLDKSWHGIQFLLTGTDGGGNAPLDFIAVGGKEIGKIDVGYGPARALSPELVADIASRLASLPDDELRSRFDPPKMMAKKIYPEIWSDPEDDTDGYLMEHVTLLREAIAGAVSRGQGLVLVLR
jgi:hypothetical protein